MKCSDEKEKLTSAMLFNDGAAMNTTYGANSAVRSIFIACGSTSRIAILPSPWMQRMVSNLVPYIASSCVPIFYDSVRGLFMFGLLSQRQRSSAANFVQNNRRTRWRERVKWTRYQDKWNNQKTRIFVRVKTFLHNTNYFAIFVGQIECVLATKQLHTFRSCYEKLNVLIINVIFACSSVRPTIPPKPIFCHRPGISSYVYMFSTFTRQNIVLSNVAYDVIQTHSPQTMTKCRGARSRTNIHKNKKTRYI